jgi:hypothetical protein
MYEMSYAGLNENDDGHKQAGQISVKYRTHVRIVGARKVT